MGFYELERIIDFLIRIYMYLIIGYVLMSWMPQLRETPIGQVIGRLVEPYLRPFRSIIPPLGGMIDVSPIIAIITLHYAGKGFIVILEYIFGLR